MKWNQKDVKVQITGNWNFRTRELSFPGTKVP